jgi:aryl-alcohol dehydrogenase-like predicted oxidoreductase
MTTQTVQTRQLGNSDMHITPMGFGAWAVGGEWAWGWGAQDDQESIEAIHRALDLGMNWIDTAAIYGLGHSEEVVAKALEGRANRPYVFTKCEQNWDANRKQFESMKADDLRRECENSLRRLKVDVIDLYQVHWPRPDEEIEEGWETLAKLKEEGKVRYIGLSNFSVSQMERAMKIAPITSLQPPYSAIKRGVGDEILPFCQQHNIGVIVYSPMQAGLLTGAMSPERVANLDPTDWRRRDEEFQEPRFSRNLALAQLMKDIGARHGRSAGEVAIAWTLHNPAVTAAIVGFRNAKQVDGQIGALTFRLSEDEYNEIEAWVGQNP